MANSSDLPGLGERLKQARLDAGLSQGQVANLLGLHRPAVSEMESESRRVTAGELRDLAALYDVSTAWLLGEPYESDEPLKIAARKLEGLKPEDLDTVMRVIDSFRR